MTPAPAKGTAPPGKGYSPYTATAVVVANMIGTGVFTSLGFQLLDLQVHLPPAASLGRGGRGGILRRHLLCGAGRGAGAPMDAMAGKIEVGYVAATHAFGPAGGAIMGVTLAVLLVSTVSAIGHGGAPRAARDR